jgi:hypothetical protein
LPVRQVSEGEMQKEALFALCEEREPLKEQNLELPRNGEAGTIRRRRGGDIVPKWCPDSGGMETVAR